MNLQIETCRDSKGSRSIPGSLVLGGILVVYLLLGVVYSVSLPILEAPDEMWHYSYVRYLTSERRLPSWDAQSPLGQQSSQPPLYYTVAALATAGVDSSRLENLPDRNPHWGYPAAGTVHDNKNMFFHRRLGDEAFPWQGVALVVHLARLVNLGFGVLTVGAAYLLAQEVFAERVGAVLAATAVVAFNPQFIFISSAINNDAAVSAFSTLALWLLVGGLRRGFSLERVATLGGVVGLATLSKVSALALLPFAILVIGLRTRLMRDQPGAAITPASEDRSNDRLHRFALHSLLFLTVVLVVSGWWYARNAALYGDPLGVATHFETWGAHEEPLSLAQMWSQLPNVELSFWAAFGWGNVHLPFGFYTVLRVVVRLALLGLLVWAVGIRRARGGPGFLVHSLAILALWALVVFAALLRWMQLVEAALGRLLFPAIGAIALLITWGLIQFSRHVSRTVGSDSHWGQRVPRFSLVLLTGGLLSAAVASPLVAIRPAYAQPALLSDAEVARRSDPIRVDFGEAIRLVGHRTHPRSATPGQEVDVTLCWEAIGVIEDDYPYFVHLLGRDERVIGARDTHPGLGRFPTSHWAPGDTFCDVVRVPIGISAPAPSVYDVAIGWYEPEAGDRLPARGAGGEPIDMVTLGRIKVTSGEQRPLEVPNRLQADLGGEITLLGYGIDGGESQPGPGRTINVTLYWQAQTRPTADYTVFLHLAAPSGPPYAQDDGQPREGTYPTSFWDVGEVVTETRTLRVPADLDPGDYQLVVGMYLLETGTRLPAFNVQGERLPEDAFPLTKVKVDQ